MKRVIIVILLVFLSCGNKKEDIVGPDASDVIAEGKIDQGGGVIEINDQDNEYYGLRIEIPEGAVTQETQIVIKETEILPSLPSEITAAKRPIKIESSVHEFDKPIKLMVPVDETSDENISVIAQFDENNETWTVPQLCAIDTLNNILTVETNHFSILQVVSVNLQSIAYVECDPPFDISVDKFPISNMGAPECPEGFCWGIAAFTSWYFENKRQLGSLSTKYNDYVAQMIACEVYCLQHDWQNYVGRLLDLIYGSAGCSFDNVRTAVQLITSMKLTGNPQMLGLAENCIPPFGDCHAVLVYKFEYPKFYVYDSNWLSPHKLTLDGLKFLSYDDKYAGIIHAPIESEINEWNIEDIFNKYEDEEFDSSGTVVIDVSPDGINAEWSLNGPYGYLWTLSNDTTLTELIPGEYSIYWGEVSGWITPENETKMLGDSGIITLSGNYIEEDEILEDVFIDPRDGQEYRIVKIGDKWWFAENLNYYTGWSYGYDPSNTIVYGALYSWGLAMSACPPGWHIPSQQEWIELAGMFGGYDNAGGALKESGTTHWVTPNSGATNESGFTALPGGWANWYSWEFLCREMGVTAKFWSSTTYESQGYTVAKVLTLSNADSKACYNDGMEINSFFASVRCVKDD